MTDIVVMGSYFNTIYPDPGYEPRFDLNADGKINLSDTVAFGPVFNKWCDQLLTDGPARPGPSGDPGPMGNVALDANAGGKSPNAATSLGSREECFTIISKPVAEGTSTGGNAPDTLNDKAVVFDESIMDFGVRIVSGAGAGQIRRVVSVIGGHLVVAPDWSVVPDESSAYEVLASHAIDITAVAIPGYDPEKGIGGLAGFGFNLTFDPGLVAVIGVNAGGDADTLLAAAGDRIPFEVIDADGSDSSAVEPLPAASGNLRIDMADLSKNYESGDGVLARVLVMPFASGPAEISLTDALVVDATGRPYEMAGILSGSLAIDTAC